MTLSSSFKSGSHTRICRNSQRSRHEHDGVRSSCRSNDSVVGVASVVFVSSTKGRTLILSSSGPENFMSGVDACDTTDDDLFGAGIAKRDSSALSFDLKEEDNSWCSMKDMVLQWLVDGTSFSVLCNFLRRRKRLQAHRLLHLFPSVSTRTYFYLYCLWIVYPRP